MTEPPLVLRPFQEVVRLFSTENLSSHLVQKSVRYIYIVCVRRANSTLLRWSRHFNDVSPFGLLQISVTGLKILGIKIVHVLVLNRPKKIEYWRYRDDIFDPWTLGHAKLLEFTQYNNSLYPTIKFTLVHSPTSLDVLDEGYIQTDIYFKPTDNHIYLLCNSAHPAHCSKAIPYGVATRVRRNCSTSEAFGKCSLEYQSYLINRGYNPSQVKQQFEKAKSIPRENLLVTSTKQSKKVFPLVLDFN